VCAMRLVCKHFHIVLMCKLCDSRKVGANAVVGGVSFNELLQAILQVSTLNLVGCDVNELSPVYDPSGASTAVACKVLRELLLAVR